MSHPLPAHPMDDRERLEAVRRAALLDGLAGEAFARLARLAARVLHVPTALVVLWDGSRPHLRGGVGLPAQDGEPPLPRPLAEHAASRADPCLVDEVAQHPALRDDPVLAGWHAAALALVPLVTADGISLGTLCLVSRRPRHWTDDDLHTLLDLAAGATAEVTLRTDSAERERISRTLHDTVERFRLVMKATNDTIWEWNLETGEGSWSEGIQHMFGYAAHEVAPTYQWWAERIHPDDRERILAGTRVAIEGEASTWTDEYRFRHANGSYVTVLDRSYIARDPQGRAVRVVGSMIDITERSRAQVERERLLAREMEARAEAERANRAKSDFLAVMSHELRTPLTAIMGYSDLLLDGIPEAIPERARAQVERIDYAAKHLLELIEQVLTFSRLEEDKETVLAEWVDLRAIVSDAASLIQPLAGKKGLAFRVRLPDEPISTRVESGKVRQVVLNLLSNALKFTTQGEICVELERHDGGAVLRVRDTGIGILPEHLDQVFEPFWQAQQGNTRQVSGTGLGLSVCRRLVQLMGGEIRAASEMGRGTEFVVQLPCGAARREEHPAG